MKIEGRIVGDRFSPELESAGDRQRQFPERSLKPHRADHNAHELDRDALAGALGRVIAPSPGGDPDARDKQQREEDREQPANAAAVMIGRVADEEKPSVIEGIGAHRRLRPYRSKRPCRRSRISAGGLTLNSRSRGWGSASAPGTAVKVVD